MDKGGLSVIHNELVKLCSGPNNTVINDIRDTANKYREGNHIVFFDDLDFFVSSKEMDGFMQALRPLFTYFLNKDLDYSCNNIADPNRPNRFVVVKIEGREKPNPIVEWYKRKIDECMDKKSIST